MKFFVLVLIVVGALTAQARMSLEEQLKVVETIAKEERRNLYQQRHDQVSSSVDVMDLKKLNEWLKDDKSTDEPLDRTQVSELYACARSAMSCSLFAITLHSEYMSGTGIDRVWVLLEPNSGRTELIRQSIYSE